MLVDLFLTSKRSMLNQKTKNILIPDRINHLLHTHTHSSPTVIYLVSELCSNISGYHFKNKQTQKYI